MGVVSSRVIRSSFAFADRKQSHQATFEVAVDDRDDDGSYVAVAARTATPDPVPAPFASYALLGSSNPNAFCQSIRASQPDPVNAARIWHVECEWSPRDGDPDDDHTDEDDPLTRPLRFHCRTEEVAELVENGWNEEELSGIDRPADTYGPIVNAAGVQPGTPLTRSRKIQVVVVKKNFATLEEIMTLQRLYCDKLNDATFYGAPAGKVYCRDIVPSEQMTAGGVTYREAEFHLAGDEQGFSFEMVNRGFSALVDLGGSEPVLLPIINRDFTFVSEPKNLELDGTETPQGQPGTTIHWRLQEKVDFSGMGIGTTIPAGT